MIVLYIVLAIVVLLMMVTIHEFGHYTAGKMLGFKINEFSNVPDESYLNLPDKLKDVTKYGEGKAK